MPARRRIPLPLLTAALLLLAVLPVAPPARAAAVVVNTSGDAPGATCPATCTLRAAIAAAAPGDTITFAAGLASPIVLAQGELLIDKNLTIQGHAGSPIAVDGNNATRVFNLTTGSLAINNLTIQNGDATGDFGGGIRAHFGSTLVATNVTVSESSAAQGGGIFVAGTAELTNVTLGGNSANQGGGIINGNVMMLANVTIAGNSANQGGGIWNLTGLPIRNTVRNTIVANNTAPIGANCYNEPPGALTSEGHNLEFPGTACGFTQPGDVQGQDPLLGPLRRNPPGAIETMALLPGSPAVDAGDPGAPGSGGTACAATDQRGVRRPKGPRCDIGAYEFVPRVVGQGSVPVAGGTASFRVEGLIPAGGGTPTGLLTWQAPGANIRSSTITSLVFGGNATTSTATMTGACTNLTTRQPCTYTLTVSAPTNGGTPNVTLSLNNEAPQGGPLASGTVRVGEARAND